MTCATTRWATIEWSTAIHATAADGVTAIEPTVPYDSGPELAELAAWLNSCAPSDSRRMTTFEDPKSVPHVVTPYAATRPAAATGPTRALPRHVRARPNRYWGGFPGPQPYTVPPAEYTRAWELTASVGADGGPQ